MADKPTVTIVAARSGKAFIILVLAAILALGSLYYFSQKATAVYKAGNFDLQLFVQPAIRYWKNEPVYQRADDMADRYKPGAMVYKFPLPYQFHFIPWFDASGKQSDVFRPAFSLVYIFLYAITVLLICLLILQCFSSRREEATHVPSLIFVLLVVAFSCFFVPFFLVLGGTSGEGYILAVAVLAFASLRRFPWLSGFLFAWLACIKLYPVFLLVYPLVCRQWSVLLAALVSFILIALASVWVFGIDENLFYVQKILPILLSEGVSEDWTTSFLHTTGNQGIVKVLVSYGLLPNRLPFWVNTVRLPFVVGLLILIQRYCSQHDERSWSSVLAFALVLVTMVICLPNVFYAYFILLLFPMLALAGYLWNGKQWRWLIVLAICAGSFIVDDNWVYGMAQQAHLFEPTAEMLQEVQSIGVNGYVWSHHTMLMVLWCYGLATPFMPYVLWLALAVSLQQLRFSPGQRVSSAG